MPSPRPLSLLVLGGTSWVGGLVARRALERGHDVTCLARGETGPVPPGARHVVADRRQDGAYDAVADRPVDVLLDVTWQPNLVASAVAALSDVVEHWVLVSSCSVYRDHDTAGADESAALLEPWAGRGEAGISDYGEAKAACERVLQTEVGADRSLVCRAGLIAGYGDYSDRYGYWPARLAAMREPDERVLVPELDRPTQVVDVEDLVAWLLDSAERRAGGVFNVVGDVVPLGEVLDACAAAADVHPQFVEASDSWLATHGVAPWSGEKSLPLWLPRPDYDGFMTRSNAAATGAGLSLRGAPATVEAALAWEREQGLDRPRKAGLRRARELDLLRSLRT